MYKIPAPTDFANNSTGVPAPYKLDSFLISYEHTIKIVKFYPRTSGELTGFR